MATDNEQMNTTDSKQIEKERANPTKKIIMIAVPVVALLLVLAVVLSLTLASSVTEVAKEEVWKVKKAASELEQSEEETSVDPDASLDSTEPPINDHYEVYETRDPFRPANETGPASTNVASQGNTGTATTSTVSASEKPALVLTGTTEENGILFANVQYGTSTFAVSSGERVGESPFQVASVSQENVTFLYGDDTLSLAVGEEIVK